LSSQVLHRPHILVVDDHPAVRSGLRRSLENAGFAVSEASNKAGVRERLSQQPPVDLITLDLRLGEEDGLLLARELRAERNIPIIMITALTEPLDRVAGLEHGADDYIVKPFHSREVLLRIQSVLKRYTGHADTSEAAPARSPAEERYHCEAGVAEVNRRRLTAPAGEEIALTDAEFDILVVFLRNPARILSRDDLNRALKGRPWSPADRTLDGHIARLRKKIEPDIERPTLIRTVWGVGYVFAGEVKSTCE
jgi:DNA-binding response OmpR family regulator